MDFRLIVLIFCIVIVLITAAPTEIDDIEGMRDKRDVMDSMKSAWTEVVKTLTDAGDAVVHVFKPTEKSTIDKIADNVKGLAQ